MRATLRYMIEDAIKRFVLVGGDLTLINRRERSQVKLYKAILEVVKKADIIDIKEKR